MSVVADPKKTSLPWRTLYEILKFKFSCVSCKGAKNLRNREKLLAQIFSTQLATVQKQI